MTRLGWILLLVFLLIVGGFALLVRKGGGPAVDTIPAAVPSAPLPVARAASVPAVTASTASLVIPVSGVMAASLVDTWGQSRAAGAREHHAIDIMAPRGTPVVAAAAGIVEKIFESKDGGHTVYIRRDDPAWIDYYAHLDSYAPNLAEGKNVTQGQLLGAVGSTGDASPDAPHLHYEIKRMAAGERWWQGTDVNPYPILAGKAAAR